MKEKYIDSRDTGQVWVLETKETGRFCGPTLDHDGTDCFLAYPTRLAAQRGAAFQKETFGVDCKSVRLA
jgi:hypothetical protein